MSGTFDRTAPDAVKTPFNRSSAVVGDQYGPHKPPGRLQPFDQYVAIPSSVPFFATATCKAP